MVDKWLVIDSGFHLRRIMAQQVCGGVGKSQAASPEVQKICDEVKPQAEQKARKKFVTFVAKSFTTQVVAGTNYFIKVHVGGNEYVHLRVHQALPHAGGKLNLHEIQISKTQNDPLTYF